MEPRNIFRPYRSGSFYFIGGIMKSIKNLSVAVKQFQKMYSDHIGIYVKLCKASTNFPDGTTFYCFAFSRTGRERESPFVMDNIKKTVDLYHAIWQEFFENGRLVSIKYPSGMPVHGYQSIKLVNSKNQRLDLCFRSSNYMKPQVLEDSSLLGKEGSELENICLSFPKPIRDQYQNVVHQLKEIQKEDFIQYASQLIEKNCVSKVLLHPTSDYQSRIAYTLNNEEYSSLLMKRKQLEYYYDNHDGTIDSESVEITYQIICNFVNFYLDEHPTYEYSTNLDHWVNEQRLRNLGKLTETLQIIFESGKVIELTDSKMIDRLEKLGLIDDLSKLRKGKIKKIGGLNNEK